MWGYWCCGCGSEGGVASGWYALIVASCYGDGAAGAYGYFAALGGVCSGLWSVGGGCSSVVCIGVFCGVSGVVVFLGFSAAEASDGGSVDGVSGASDSEV